jgi:hypothetical protein
MGHTAEQEVYCSNLAGERADSDTDERKQFIHFKSEERKKEYNADYWKLEPIVGVNNHFPSFQWHDHDGNLLHYMENRQFTPL